MVVSLTGTTVFSVTTIVVVAVAVGVVAGVEDWPVQPATRIIPVMRTAINSAIPETFVNDGTLNFIDILQWFK
jgi:hypothetical protein